MKNDKSINYYAVAFIDMLGQSNELRKLDTLPNMKDDKAIADFEKVINRTI